MTSKYSTRLLAGPRKMALEPHWSCWGRGKNGHAEQGRVRGKTQYHKRGRSKASHPDLCRGIKSHLSRAGLNPGTLCGEGEELASPSKGGEKTAVLRGT